MWLRGDAESFEGEAAAMLTAELFIKIRSYIEAQVKE